MAQSADFSLTTTPKWRLPPDVATASWSWRWEPQFERVRGIGQDYYGRVVARGPTHRYLSCRVALKNTEDCVGLVVEADGGDHGQTASLSYIAPCTRALGRPHLDHIYNIPTSLTTLQYRIVSWNKDVAATGAHFAVRAWAEPNSVVAFVEALDDYVAKWRRGEYVEF